uniref:Uncharacterized protein n=1 Tax=Parascaris equorum TaxID=6256 RepID=A0A914S6Z4_PAREQ
MKSIIRPSQSRQSSGSPHRNNHPNANFIRGRPTLMSCALPRPKNRRYPWAPKSDNSRGLSTRTLLRSMLRDLRIKPQLYANCP